MSKEKAKVVFIGGYGRSGSTLLDRMLGQVEGFFSAGELGHIWDRGFGDNQLCGCGAPFAQCPFWKRVIEEAFGGLEHVDEGELKGLQRSLERMRHIPKLIFPRLRPHTYSRALSEYVEVLERLYMAIHSMSGCEFIIDSTKNPARAFLLLEVPRVELYVVHLVRDSRAVAFSWQRKKRRPEIYWKEEYMPRYNPLRSAWEWNWVNLLIHLWGRSNPHRYALVRYEDLVNKPAQTLDRLLNRLGTDVKRLNFIKGREMVWDVNHTVSGNPIRFLHGKVELQEDVKWRKLMAVSQRFIVTSITFPLLMEYKYFPRLRE